MALNAHSKEGRT